MFDNLLHGWNHLSQLFECIWKLFEFPPEYFVICYSMFTIRYSVFVIRKIRPKLLAESFSWMLRLILTSESYYHDFPGFLGGLLW